jgi:5-methylcytosine-specific restriction endonuclease McrA
MPDPTPYMEPTLPSGTDMDALERSAFYSSKRWARHRRAYLSKHPLCERCRAADRIKAASIVHHKVERLDDPGKAWDWTNFEALCGSCHTRHHNARRSHAEETDGR